MNVRRLSQYNVHSCSNATDARQALRNRLWGRGLGRLHTAHGALKGHRNELSRKGLLEGKPSEGRYSSDVPCYKGTESHMRRSM